MTIVDENGLLSKRLLIISGKGGVGKSTMTASLALLASRLGKRVMVVEVDTIPTVADLLGSKVEVGYKPQEVIPGISVMNIDGFRAIEDYFRVKLKSQRILDKVLQSKIYKYFVAAAPGLKELMCVGKLWDLVDNQSGKDGRPLYDLVLADMPATGHGFSHLRMPQTAVDTLKIGFVKEEAAKILRLFQDPERAAFLIVTLAEEMPVNESIEMRRLVTGTLKFHVGGIFVNGVYPEVGEGPEQEEQRGLLAAAMAEMEKDPKWRPLLESALSVQRRRDMNRKYIEVMKKEFSEPLIVLPFIFSRVFGPETIERLSSCIAEKINEIVTQPAEEPLPRASGDG